MANFRSLNGIVEEGSARCSGSMNSIVGLIANSGVTVKSNDHIELRGEVLVLLLAHPDCMHGMNLLQKMVLEWAWNELPAMWHTNLLQVGGSTTSSPMPCAQTSSMIRRSLFSKVRIHDSKRRADKSCADEHLTLSPSLVNQICAMSWLGESFASWAQDATALR
jgi:hypothetical protein